MFQSESESTGNPRAGVHLQGALICPSDEDSHTFTVNSSSGEVYKLRATDARARQEWVNRLRSVAEHHSSNLTKVWAILGNKFVKLIRNVLKNKYLL